MKKNRQFHLLLESDLKESLEREAQEEDITVSELCRRKLRESSRLVKIEMMLEKLMVKG